MKCVALRDLAGAHLGFMLCSPDLGQPAGSCVFVPTPGLPTGWVGRLLAQRQQAGESRWEVIHREPLSVVVRTPGTGLGMFFVLDGPGAGGWGFDTGPGRRTIGRAEVVAPCT